MIELANAAATLGRIAWILTFCLKGPGVQTPVETPFACQCDCLDYDRDSDVDLRDVAEQLNNLPKFGD